MLILASASPRRRELLKRAGFEFKSIMPEIKEEMQKGEKPEKFVERMAFEKVRDVEKKMSLVKPIDIFIGSDTVGLLDNKKVLGKPQTEEEAKKMLKMLSGKTHTVMSGVCLKKGDKTVFFNEKTKVTFKKLTQKEIDNYVRSGEPMDKAVGYAIQGRASLFVEKIQGDFSNVVGLPLFRLGMELEKLGM